MANDLKAVRAALARAVAEHQITDDVIEKAARQIANIKHPIRGIDVCTYGICLDFFFEGNDWWSIMPELVAVDDSRLRIVEIFPWGIPWPDLFQVRVTRNFDMMTQVHR